MTICMSESILGFVAGLHKIKNADKRIDEVIQTTGLEKEQHKIIGTLSKGYKQRVGLAQAIIHDPKVLILDEPTSGLDMNQLVGIRQLIREMGKEKTVIFSSHIMQEIQALCHRVLIINDGVLIADDSIADLQARVSGQTKVVVVFSNDQYSKDPFAAVPGVISVHKEGDRLTILGKDDVDIKPGVFKAAVDAGLTIVEMKSELMNMESIFRQLTQKQEI
jgi:ABC-2 type transport system ATP-binding protein